MKSTQEDNNSWISLDDWKPSNLKKSLVPLSNWRRNSINPERPGFEIGMPYRDDFNKINYYIKNGQNKYEIMRAFKINHSIFNRIKDGLYCPERGILENDKEIKIRRMKTKNSNKIYKNKKGIFNEIYI